MKNTLLTIFLLASSLLTFNAAASSPLSIPEQTDSANALSGKCGQAAEDGSNIVVCEEYYCPQQSNFCMSCNGKNCCGQKDKITYPLPTPSPLDDENTTF